MENLINTRSTQLRLHRCKAEEKIDEDDEVNFSPLLEMYWKHVSCRFPLLHHFMLIQSLIQLPLCALRIARRFPFPPLLLDITSY